MHSKSRSKNQMNYDPYKLPQTMVCSEPWWHSLDSNPPNPDGMQGNASDTSSQSADGMSHANGSENEDDGSDESKNARTMHSGMFRLLQVVTNISTYHFLKPC